MKSRWLLWLVAVLIGSALAFPPVISAAEKKAQQPCAAGEKMEKKEEGKKEEKKVKKAKAKKKAEKEKKEEKK